MTDEVSDVLGGTSPTGHVIMAFLSGKHSGGVLFGYSVRPHISRVMVFFLQIWII